MAKINTYGTVTPAAGDKLLGTDVSDTTNDANGETVNFLVSDVLALVPSPSGNAQTGTSYTLVLGDGNDFVTMNNAASNTLTVPTNASVAFSVGTVISVVQLGAGATTITGATGVTINGVSAGSATLTAQHAAVSLLKLDTNTWNLAGDHGGVA